MASRYRRSVRRVGPAGAGPGDSIAADPLRAVPQQLALGQHRELEAERVAAAAALAERVGQHGGAQPERVRHRHDGQPADHLGEVGRHGPGDQAAPVVADDDRVGLAERADQPGRVRRRRDQVVAAGRLVAAAVPAHVRGGDPVARRAERGSADRARSTRTPGTRAAAGPAGRRRSPRRETGCRWRSPTGATRGRRCRSTASPLRGHGYRAGARGGAPAPSPRRSTARSSETVRRVLGRPPNRLIDQRCRHRRPARPAGRRRPR